nr:MAG TPA: nucelotide kinase [Caudoviricetes sp.]
MTSLETQIGGDHYKELSIQPIEYILANKLGFCEGNVVKYITRYKSKNGLEDLKKAKHYIDMLIENYSEGK